MPPWRCPHCGAPQPETSRCWVCRRSTTCCATCRHYRRSVATGLGFCALDPRRQALHGDEIRGCWTGGEVRPVVPVPPVVAPSEAPDRWSLWPDAEVG